MNQLPTWLQVMQALLTPAIAFGVGAIAFMQWRTAHQKLVFDIFSRRFELYRDVRSVVEDAVMSPSSIELDLLARVHRLRQEAQFLFGDDVVEKLWSLEKKVMRVEMAATLRVGASAIDLETAAVGPLLREISELLTNIADSMKPYMRLNQKFSRSAAEWFNERNAARLSYADEHQR